MTEESGRSDDPPMLLLPYYPPPKKADEALQLHQVSVFLMLTIDEGFTRNEVKKIARQEIKINGRNAKTKIMKQQQAQSKLTYAESTLREATRVARMAYELAPDNARYKEHLTKLEHMEI